MTEDEARAWIAGRFGREGTVAMERLITVMTVESERQNLIARSTFPSIWTRHIVDSAQLLDLADGAAGNWLDIGTGAGFPGLIVAALGDRPVTLVEPRRLRADFLCRAAGALGLAERVTIICSRIERVRGDYPVISARAVAPLITLLEGAFPCSSEASLWLLPKGRGAEDEIADANRFWRGMFHVKQSITDPQSRIILGTGVARR